MSASARSRSEATRSSRGATSAASSFPAAELKVFLVADPEERARRRSAERPGIGVDALAADLRARDERDAVNTQPADDAVLLDTTDLTIDEVVERIDELVEARR